MAAPTNTLTYKTIFKDVYQLAWYQQPVYPVLAYEKFYNKLEKGQTIKWSKTTDPRIRSLGSDGAFTTTGRTVTDDSLTINQFPSVSDRVPFPEEALDHRDTYKKWAMDQAQAYLWKVDADILEAASAAAASTITGSDLGSSGAITPSESNVIRLFSTGATKLMLQGVLQRGYSGTKRYMNNRKEDYGDRMPVAIISPEVYGFLLQVIGMKNTAQGDDVLRAGYLGYIFGFNTFVSNHLSFTQDYIVAAANATDGDTFTIAGVTFTLKASPSAAGEIDIGTTAAGTATNIAAALNSIFTAITTTYPTAVVASSLTPAQENAMRMVTASASDETVTITVKGHGKVTTSDTAASDGFDATTAVVHNIFATSQAVALAETYLPKSVVTPENGVISIAEGGYVAKDILTYGVYGKAVFTYQQRMIVDAQIAASALSVPNVALNG